MLSSKPPNKINSPLLTEQERNQYAAQLSGLRISMAVEYAKRKDILNWGRVLFPKKFPLPFCKPLHNYLVDIRMDPFTDTEAPRYHAKTTIKCFLIPIFQALVEPELFDFYLNVQATDEKAMAINRSVRNEIENNEALRAIYGDQVNDKKWTDGQFVLKNGVVFTAVSAGQSIRGLNFENRRPDYVVVDDLYNDEDINNLESTEKKTDWLRGTLVPAMAIGKRTSFHLQGTAINEADALHIFKNTKGITQRTFCAIVDEDKKLALWPEAKPFDELIEMRDTVKMGTLLFNREMMNERRTDAESIIKLAWLKDWEYDPAEMEFTDHFYVAAVVVGVDPSIGKKMENDFTGVAVVIVTAYDDGEGNDFWIDELYNEKLSLDKRVELLQTIGNNRSEETQVTQVNIEAIAGFKDFSAEVIRRTNLPVNEIDKVPDKITALENKSKFFENGKVHLNKNIDPKLKEMLKRQLTTNHPKHDDLRDALLRALGDDSGLWNFVQ